MYFTHIYKTKHDGQKQFVLSGDVLMIELPQVTIFIYFNSTTIYKNINTVVDFSRICYQSTRERFLFGDSGTNRDGKKKYRYIENILCLKIQIYRSFKFDISILLRNNYFTYKNQI